MSFKVFIPCAGVGSRLDSLTRAYNKALVSVDNKPVISHIVEKFDKSTEFVIALGYKGDTIKEYLSLAYPEISFDFIFIDKFEGPGSGLGYTVLSCKESLQCPFIFISNDTIVSDEIPTPKKIAGLNNWLGYSKIHASTHYRSVEVLNDGKVVSLNEKNFNKEGLSYIGVCGIKDYKKFWKYMTDGTKDSISVGESYALTKMIQECDFKGVQFEWYDTGNVSSLEKARSVFENNSGPNILEKPDECIWFVNGKVVKFHKDTKFIKNRVKRAEKLYPFVPKITGNTEKMYSYNIIPGDTLSSCVNSRKFSFFLDWMLDFWEEANLSDSEMEKFHNRCDLFYRRKTYQRVEEYFNRFKNRDSDKEIINGESYPSIDFLLSRVDWKKLSEGSPCQYHGDLHFENILVSKSPQSNYPPFMLLDWRQDFQGDLHVGDIYYDLAKINHGLIISHDIITQNFYSFNRDMNQIYFDFFRKNINFECQNQFKTFLKTNGFNEEKVEVLTSLIFLNIACFHHFPYSHLLFYLGKSMLFRALGEPSQ